MPEALDIKGKKFGRLVAIKIVGTANDRHKLWLCRCDCGNEKIITVQSLISGRTVSCGCYNSERTAAFNYVHGGCGTRLYTIWKNIKQRCRNPKHPRFNDYGGRGIDVCDEWSESFDSFRRWSISNGYSDELTIDRIDNDNGYQPDNCQWATCAMQSQNKRPYTAEHKRNDKRMRCNRRVSSCEESRQLDAGEMEIFILRK